MKPDILIPDETSNKAGAQILKPLLEGAAARLERFGAWPDHCGRYVILILNETKPGETKIEAEHSVSGMNTGFSYVDKTPDNIVRRKPRSVSEIRASVEMLTRGFGRLLIELRAAPEEIVLHFLAHEIHHLDELERQRACKLPINWRQTSLAGALRSDMPDNWRAAAIGLIAGHPTFDMLDAELRTAGEIADEACADLTGLYWMKKARMRWESYAERLIDARLRDAERSQNKPGDGHRINIAQAIETVVVRGLPDLPAIRAGCWEMALAMASGSHNIAPELLTSIAALDRPLVLDASLIQPPTPGLVQRLINRASQPRGRSPR